MKIYNDGSVTAAGIRSMLHSILQFGKPILPNPEKNQLPAGIGRAVPSQRTGHLAMLLFAVLIAGSFSIGRTAVQHVGPGALTVMRFILGSALMGTAAALSLRRWPRLPAAPWRFLLLGALMGFYFITMFEALKITDPVSTGAVFTLMPLMNRSSQARYCCIHIAEFCSVTPSTLTFLHCTNRITNGRLR